MNKFIRILKVSSLLYFLLMAPGLVHAQETSKSADEILNQARAQATKEKKNVFVMFHASWCSWCHRMDSLMNIPECKDLFADNFVIAHLVVLESRAKKKLENPGAIELLAKYNGDKSGVPFWLVFDKNGRLIADGQERAPGEGLDKPGKNTGCPSTPSEIAHFIKVLKKTSALNGNQLAVIGQHFSQK